jgi:hypothetical protein
MLLELQKAFGRLIWFNTVVVVTNFKGMKEPRAEAIRL